MKSKKQPLGPKKPSGAQDKARRTQQLFLAILAILIILSMLVAAVKF